ncbi:MAG: MBOAT family O-acyltransferase, partial [Bacteroidota bacterium]
MYFLVAHRYRWLWLLAASCYFYMAFVPLYILILGFTIVIDYIAGIYIENSIGKTRKRFLLASIIANIGVLAVFKYFNFFIENFNAVSEFFHAPHLPYLNILLPIGLSFHTFQAMSYTIEVYRGNQKAERHFGIYALYVMFYPQLVAGPIERPQNILHQFHEKKNFNYKDVSQGLQLMVWGLFKKAVIADRLSLITDQVFNSPQQYPAATLCIAAFFFSFQIFCDFSGYCDIALGAAQVMGYKLMINFRRPYHAVSISDFWRRWHISLSSWFRDYLYISMGGNRVSRYRWYFNLFFVFMISGLWHGANWTFIVWGALHGLYLVVALIKERIVKENFQERVQSHNLFRKVISTGITFALVTITWIFFRANSVTDAVHMIGRIPTGITDLLIQGIHFNELKLIDASPLQLQLSFLLILFMELIHIAQ